MKNLLCISFSSSPATTIAGRRLFVSLFDYSIAEIVAAISLGALVLSFIELGNKVVSQLKDFHGTSQEAPKDSQATADRLELLVITAEAIEHARRHGAFEKRSESALGSVIEGTTVQVKLLDKCVKKLLPASSDSRWPRSHRIVLSLRQENRLFEAERRLARYESTLTLFFSNAARRCAIRILPKDKTAHAYYSAPQYDLGRTRQTLSDS